MRHRILRLRPNRNSAVLVLRAFRLQFPQQLEYRLLALFWRACEITSAQRPMFWPRIGFISGFNSGGGNVLGWLALSVERGKREIPDLAKCVSMIVFRRGRLSN